MELKDKTIVVTGGASGIGREMCRRFHREGARNIVVADLNFEDAKSVAEEIHGIAKEVDVSAENDIVELIDFTEANLGPIDLFCSNAGIGWVTNPEGQHLDTKSALYIVPIEASYILQ